MGHAAGGHGGACGHCHPQPDPSHPAGPPTRSTTLDTAMEALRPTLEACGQGHLAEGWEGLSPEQQASLLAELQAIDFPGLAHIFKASMGGEGAAPAEATEPVRDVTTLKVARAGGRAGALRPASGRRLPACSLAGYARRQPPPGLPLLQAAPLPQPPPSLLPQPGHAQASSAEDRARWRALGLEMIAGGRLGALLLAGGQGTRLGSSAPKGCYNIGLPSKKSLFQLQAERIARLQALAAEHVDGPGAPVT